MWRVCSGERNPKGLMLKNIFIIVFFGAVIYLGYRMISIPEKIVEPELSVPVTVKSKIPLDPELYADTQLPVVALVIDPNEWEGKKTDGFVKGLVDVFEGNKAVVLSRKQFLQVKGEVDRDSVLNALLLSGDKWEENLLRNRLKQSLLTMSGITIEAESRLSVLYLNTKYAGLCYTRRGVLQPPASEGYGSDLYFEKALYFIKKYGIESDLHFSEVENRMDIDKYIDFFSTVIYLSEESNLTDALKSSELCSALMTNKKFKAKFIKRFSALLESNFEPTKVIAQIDAVSKFLSPEIKRHYQLVADESGYALWLKKIEALRGHAGRRVEALLLEIKQLK